ncbi:MAG: glycosyltransferase, partial [Candidatus Nanoperiomorbaceae bacterium]
VADEIHTFYHRDATVLWPNVDTETFTKLAQKVDARTKQKLRQELFDGQPFFITAGRQVNWKRLDIAIDFAKKTGQNLLLVGDGAEHANLVARANGAPNIKFLPHYNGATDIAKYFVAARAFLFTSLEPFGITPVECLACGTPVIAFSSGGSRDFIQDGQNGVFFDGQNAESLAKAVTRFSKIKWNQSHVRQSATQFSNDNFVKSLKVILNEVYTTHLYK